MFFDARKRYRKFYRQSFFNTQQEFHKDFLFLKAVTINSWVQRPYFKNDRIAFDVLYNPTIGYESNEYAYGTTQIDLSL